MSTNWIEVLKDSELVWQFQRYFGVCKKVTKQQQQQASSLLSTTTTTTTIPNNNKTFSNGTCRKLANGFTTTANGYGFADVVSSDSGVEDTLTESDDSGESNGDLGGDSDDDGYHITNKFWYYLFAFGTALGDETFYACFFPFWFWNIDGAVGRRVVMVWVLVMYVGQGLKDVICWPRPFCPPAVRLEKKWALEFGMPSTHAMVGLGVPYSVLYYTMHRYEYPVYVGIFICCIWCVVVCCSRIYFGMHTILDIIGGLILAVGLLAIFLPLLDSLDHFQLTNVYAPALMIILILLMMVLYPSGKRWTPARGDTTIILGVGAGCSFGSWLNFQLGIIRGPPIPPPYKILWPTYEMVGLTLLRACIGILIVVATRAFFKSISYIIVCWILRLDPRDKSNDKKLTVELSCKFITYAVIGFNATYLAPAVFRSLHIERVMMFTEV